MSETLGTATATATCVGHLLVAASGEIDLATAPQLRADMVAAATGASSLVVLDLRDVSFLDSVGISVIIGGHRRLVAQGRRLHLAAPGPMVRKVLTVTRVDAVIPTFDTVGEAVAGCPLAHVA